MYQRDTAKTSVIVSRAIKWLRIRGYLFLRKNNPVFSVQRISNKPHITVIGWHENERNKVTKRQRTNAQYCFIYSILSTQLFDARPIKWSLYAILHFMDIGICLSDWPGSHPRNIVFHKLTQHLLPETSRFRFSPFYHFSSCPSNIRLSSSVQWYYKLRIHFITLN